MRVVFTTDYYPPHIGGGVEAVVNEVASRLVSDGHHVMVVTLGRQGWPRSEILDGVYVHRFQSTRLNRVTGIELTVSLESFRRMTTTIEGFAPDIVNAHHQFFTTTPAALSAARKLGIPSVLTLHIAGLDDFGGWRGAASRIYETALARRLVARADALGRGEPGGGSGNRATARPGCRGDTQRSRSGAVPTWGSQNRGSCPIRVRGPSHSQ